MDDSILRANEKAEDDYPSILVEGHLLHVFEQDSFWSVWLNCEDMPFTGLCIGTGATRDIAVQQAVAVCEAVAAKLQEPT